MPFDELSESPANRTSGRVMSLTALELGIAYYHSAASRVHGVTRVAMQEAICTEGISWMGELMSVFACRQVETMQQR